MLPPGHENTTCAGFQLKSLVTIPAIGSNMALWFSAMIYKQRIMITFRLFLILLLSWLAAGCGQPGPLYLPGSKAPVHVEPEPKPEYEKDR
jgi:predicted small lipoprotein YifL